jgi:hypothetical protein
MKKNAKRKIPKKNLVKDIEKRRAGEGSALLTSLKIMGENRKGNTIFNYACSLPSNSGRFVPKCVSFFRRRS